MMNYLHQINISKGGVPKTAIMEAEVTFDGIVGDKQKNLQFHGGPDRAVCLFSLQTILQLQQEGHPIAPGSTGENLTISLQEYASLRPGDRLRIGKEVVLEITSYTVPCKTIKESFTLHEFTRISQKLHPGESRIYARVIQPGRIKALDPILLERRTEASNPTIL